MSQSLYTDGGLLSPNPSAIGGTWAWCLVEREEIIASASGSIVPTDIGRHQITSNFTELYAAIEGMENLPFGWKGKIWTDSTNTASRLNQKSPPLRNIPEEFAARFMAARMRLGNHCAELVAGHPSVDEIVNGWRGSVRTSPFNVYVDKLCKKETKKFFEEYAGPRSRWIEIGKAKQ